MNVSLKIRTQQLGVSLIELMIAMAIGLVLVGGTLFVYTSARGAYATNDAYVLMQENARFALSVIEPDLHHAGFWGAHKDPTVIIGSAKELERNGAVFPGVTKDCEDNWVVRFDQHIEGFNDERPEDWGCLTEARYKDNSDMFVVRHTSPEPVDTVDLQDGQIYMRSSEAPLSEVFVGNNEPTTLPDSAENYRVEASSYYVSKFSLTADENDNNPIPSLRRIQLMTVAGEAQMVESEITTGVEDMQIQYGIGPPDATGIRNGVSVYVNDISNLTLPNNTVRSVRVWLLMRSERKESDYVDDKTYQLADKVVGPFAINLGETTDLEKYRRMVVSKTIFFRNLH